MGVSALLTEEEKEELLEQEDQGNGTGVNSLNSFLSYPNQETNQRPSKPTLEKEALHGLAGEIVRTVDPYTEADQVALLVNILVGSGNLIGRTPYFKVEYSHHYLNLFVSLVGQSSKGRKGQSWSAPKYIFSEIDSEWTKQQVTSGLSSGEGLIYAVRDAVYKQQPVKEHGRVVEYQEVMVEEAASDKRLLLVEEELAQALKVMSREGNILSTVIRQAWDTGNLHPLTRNNPMTATDAHISIIGHITEYELLRQLNETERANGFANRFIWLLVGRSKYVSKPKGVPTELLDPLTSRLDRAITFARTVGEIERTPEAEVMWAEVYPELSDGKPGMVGAITSRAEAQVMRIACLYGLLDQCQLVKPEHLNAALALWDYSEKSARLIFGEELGDRNVDRAVDALRAKGHLTQTDLWTLFGRNIDGQEMERVIDALLSQGFAGSTIEPSSSGDGRPSVVLHSLK